MKQYIKKLYSDYLYFAPRWKLTPKFVTKKIAQEIVERNIEKIEVFEFLVKYRTE